MEFRDFTPGDWIGFIIAWIIIILIVLVLADLILPGSPLGFQDYARDNPNPCRPSSRC